MRLQRDSYAPKSCAFDAANVQFLRAHLCKSHPVLQQTGIGFVIDEEIITGVFAVTFRKSRMMRVTPGDVPAADLAACKYLLDS